jgi:hypothetical protein
LESRGLSQNRPIIVFGTGRSGTTIISEALFRHPKLAYPSNYHERFPKFQKISYLRRIFDNAIWRYEGKKKQLNDTGLLNKYAFTPGESYAMWEYLCRNEVDFSRGFLLNERLSDETREHMRFYFHRIVQYQGRDRLAFKLTGPSRMGFLLSIFPDAIFINISRKPISTISSWLNVDFWQDKGMNQLWWQGAYTPQEIEWADRNSDKPHLLTALQYRKLNETLKEEIKKYKPRIYNMSFEEFTKKPKEEIRQMVDFCQLDWSNWIDKYMNNNPIRLEDRPDEVFFSKEVLDDINKVLEYGAL